MVLGLRRVAALGRGNDPFGPGVLAPVHGDVTGAWLAAAHDAEVAWADDAVVEASGAATLVAHLNEVTVHTWGLVIATGQGPAWDPLVLSLAFDGIRFLSAEHRGGRLRRPLPVSDDAPLIDRLVAWNGRQAC